MNKMFIVLIAGLSFGSLKAFEFDEEQGVQRDYNTYRKQMEQTNAGSVFLCTRDGAIKSNIASMVQQAVESASVPAQNDTVQPSVKMPIEKEEENSVSEHYKERSFLQKHGNDIVLGTVSVAAFAAVYYIVTQHTNK